MTLNELFVQELRLVKMFTVGQLLVWSAYFVGEYFDKVDSMINQLIFMLSFVAILVLTMDIPMVNVVNMWLLGIV